MTHPAGPIQPHSTAKEEAVERAILEESSGLSEVKKAPTGMPTPAGGWSVPFADGFGAPLGIGGGQDNFWYPNRFSSQPAGENQKNQNANELAFFNSSQVHVGPQGLELAVTRDAGQTCVESAETKNYLGSMVETVNRATMPAGYNFFNFQLGAGSTFAFECVCKFPVDTGEMNNAMWAVDPPWHQEFDWWEAWGWNDKQKNLKYYGGITWLPLGGEGSSANWVQGRQQIGLKFDPSAGFHRYGVLVYPNNTFSMYVDGVLQTGFEGFGGNGIMGPPPVTPSGTYMGLILQNTLRVFEENFQSGTRTFTVRSMAVYQDTPHLGQNTIGGGIAPGTVLV